SSPVRRRSSESTLRPLPGNREETCSPGDALDPGLAAAESMRDSDPSAKKRNKEDCVVFDHSSSSAADALDRVLRDASTSKRTRRWLLERAALGAVGI